MDECLKHHADCSKTFLKGWKPSRLLDISKDEIKLVQGERAEAREHYATLSHCWGEDKFSVLTADLEAMITVRRLGIRYLWIDCYCILQGDNDEAREDWKYESLRMGRVYANALLNIGALESKGPSEGLFRCSSTAPAQSAIIHWPPTREDGTIWFRITQRVDTETELLRRMQESRLMGRGWVFQECVTAPRMLSFAHDYLLKNRRVRHELDIYAIKFDWITVLGAYCKSILTYPEKDLLAALDGVGMELAKLSSSRYEHKTLASTLPCVLLYEPVRLRYDGSSYTPGDETALEAPPRVTRVMKGLLIQRDETRPTWHWSSRHPKVKFNPVDDSILFKASPLVYAFMSDNDYEPHPDQSSIDYWPNLLLIG
ncbi:heterokaryon incompatibility protein-domain-containing protein [Xylaria sp. FL1042]|nr:heterokaryon incompatibility protein-domain-containing protein [Xylaria sp. FL1042]